MRSYLGQNSRSVSCSSLLPSIFGSILFTQAFSKKLLYSQQPFPCLLSGFCVDPSLKRILYAFGFTRNKRIRALRFIVMAGSAVRCRIPVSINSACAT